MHGTANIGRDLIGLDRIVAILLVLAELAEDAALSFYPVRCAMLWGLRMADARVKDFAGRYPFWMGLPPRPYVEAFDGNDRDAALSLALSLRVLASILADMIAALRRRQFLYPRFDVAGLARGSRLRLGCAGLRRLPASLAENPDTS